MFPEKHAFVKKMNKSWKFWATLKTFLFAFIVIHNQTFTFNYLSYMGLKFYNWGIKDKKICIKLN